MADDWQPEAVVRLRLEHLKKEFIDYINVNSEKIDDNIPVFFGQVIASLDKTLPGINEDSFDQFIDAMAFGVLEASKRSDDIPFVEKLFDYAMRNKRGKRDRTVYDILLGMKMLNNGKYAEAAAQLKRYRSVDAIICPAIAYCFFVLSSQQTPAESSGESQRFNEMSLASREQMIELVRLNPPVNRLQDMDIAEDPQDQQNFLVHDHAGNRLVPQRARVYPHRDRKSISRRETQHKRGAPQYSDRAVLQRHVFSARALQA